MKEREVVWQEHYPPGTNQGIPEHAGTGILIDTVGMHVNGVGIIFYGIIITPENEITHIALSALRVTEDWK